MRSALIALTVLISGAAFAQQDLSQSGLVGKLENPTIITDTAQWPKKFGEAPALAELVKAGKLPAVDQRIPQEPMVIKPLRSIGKYGGTWRRGFLGPGDSENGNRVRSSDKLLFWDVTGTKIAPGAAKGFETSADGRRVTLFLRKGMRWSDGAPFTADDFMFWYEDLYSNKDIVPTPIADMQPQGKPGRLVKVDEEVLQIAITEMGRCKWWSEVARKMQKHAASAGFSVVPQYVGHGIGRIMHENPQVPNFVSRDSKEARKNDFKLEEGLVLAVEPMVNMGRAEVRTLSDHWTVVTQDGMPSVHVEHTLALSGGGVIVITADPEPEPAPAAPGELARGDAKPQAG